jgi:hypothetical protein
VFPHKDQNIARDPGCHRHQRVSPKGRWDIPRMPQANKLENGARDSGRSARAAPIGCACVLISWPSILACDFCLLPKLRRFRVTPVDISRAERPSRQTNASENDSDHYISGIHSIQTFEFIVTGARWPAFRHWTEGPAPAAESSPPVRPRMRRWHAVGLREKSAKKHVSVSWKQCVSS